MNDYLELQQQLFEAQQNVQDLTSKNKTLTELVEQLDDQVASLTHDVSNLTTQLETLQADYDTLHDAYTTEVEQYDHLLVTYQELKIKTDAPITTSNLYHTVYPFKSLKYKPDDAPAWLSASMTDRIITWNFTIGAMPNMIYYWGADYSVFNTVFLTQIIAEHADQRFEEHTVTTTGTSPTLSIDVSIPYEDGDYCYLPVRIRPLQDRVTAYKVEFGYAVDATIIETTLEDFNSHTFLFFRTTTTQSST